VANPQGIIHGRYQIHRTARQTDRKPAEAISCQAPPLRPVLNGMVDMTCAASAAVGHHESCARQPEDNLARPFRQQGAARR